MSAAPFPYGLNDIIKSMNWWVARDQPSFIKSKISSDTFARLPALVTGLTWNGNDQMWLSRMVHQRLTQQAACKKGIPGILFLAICNSLGFFTFSPTNPPASQLDISMEPFRKSKFRLWIHEWPFRLKGLNKQSSRCAILPQAIWTKTTSSAQLLRRLLDHIRNPPRRRGFPWRVNVPPAWSYQGIEIRVWGYGSKNSSLACGNVFSRRLLCDFEDSGVPNSSSVSRKIH